MRQGKGFTREGELNEGIRSQGNLRFKYQQGFVPLTITDTSSKADHLVTDRYHSFQPIDDPENIHGHATILAHGLCTHAITYNEILDKWLTQFQSRTMLEKTDFAGFKNETKNGLRWPGIVKGCRGGSWRGGWYSRPGDNDDHDRFRCLRNVPSIEESSQLGHAENMLYQVAPRWGNRKGIFAPQGGLIRSNESFRVGQNCLGESAMLTVGLEKASRSLLARIRRYTLNTLRQITARSWILLVLLKPLEWQYFVHTTEYRPAGACKPRTKCMTKGSYAEI